MQQATTGAWLNCLAAGHKFSLKLAKETAVRATAEDASHAGDKGADAASAIRAPDPRTFDRERIALDSLHEATHAEDPLEPPPEHLPASTSALATALAIDAKPTPDLLTSCPIVIGEAGIDGARPQFRHVAGQCSYHCGLCDYTAFDLRSLTAHSTRKHHFAALATVYAAGDGACTICIKLYPSRLNLISHLRTNKLCLLNHVLFGLMASPEAALQAAEDQRQAARENRRLGRQLSYARSPIRSLHGPLLPIFAPSDRGAASSNPQLRWALGSATVLQITASEVGVGIGRLNAAATAVAEPLPIQNEAVGTPP